MFSLFRSKNNIRVSRSHYAIYKDRPSGEKELFELAYTAKQEISLAHIRGANVWINLTADYKKEISDSSVRYQVTSRPLASTILDAHLIFYHTHPKRAFEAAFGLMTRMPSQPTLEFLLEAPIQIKAYGHLLSTFHLPSTEDIETAAYLDEKHSPGIFHVIISNVGSTITRIRNPPESGSKKMSMRDIVALYQNALATIPTFNQSDNGTLLRGYYGVVNEMCEGRIVVADTTDLASIKMRPEDHVLMGWLSTNTPLREQLGNTPMGKLISIFGSNDKHFKQFQDRLDQLDQAHDNASELKKLKIRIRKDVAEVLQDFVGAESSDVYAEYSIKALGDFYQYVLSKQ